MEKNTLIGLLVASIIIGGTGLLGSGVLLLGNQDLDSQLQETTNEYEELNSSYNALLSNLEELNQLYQNLIMEYESLDSTYYILTGEYLDLNSTYYELIDQHKQLNQTYNDLVANYDALQSDYQTLQQDYSVLSDSYNQLDQDYSLLSADYDSLESEYQLLSDSYTTLTTWIKQQILPVQYFLFAEAVRRYYEPLYLNNSESDKEWFMGAAEFARDIALHDSYQYNAFSDVSNALSDALINGSDTMELCWQIMYWSFWDWLPNWDGYGLTGNELTDINTVHQWCIDTIDYEYDSDITWGQELEFWDYFKFPVETAFRTMGDCEDQAILEAAYLESCGFETAIALIHDPDHPTYGSFYHGTLLVHLEDTAQYSGEYLWSLGNVDPYEEYTWIWLDPTWNVPFGSTPAWLQDYINVGGISSDIVSIAICDIGGAVGQGI